MINIIPSIPTDDLNELYSLITQAEGVVDRFSVDIVDGKFADNKTVDPSVLENFETSLRLDYQLMVIEPVDWVERCVKAKAERIIGHVEEMSSQHAFLKKVYGYEISAGLALNLESDISRLDGELLYKLDVILLMSVPVGFGGQKFDVSVLEKIEKLAQVRSESNFTFKIHVDGGITNKNIIDVALAGADEVSIGKRIFEGDLKANIESYKIAIQNLGILQ